MKAGNSWQTTNFSKIILQHGISCLCLQSVTNSVVIVISEWTGFLIMSKHIFLLIGGWFLIAGATFRLCTTPVWAFTGPPFNICENNLLRVQVKHKKVKGKQVKLSPYLNDQALCYKDVWGNGCIDPHALDLYISWRWVVSFMPQWHYLWGNHFQYPLDRRLCGSQSQSGRGEEKNPTPTRNWTLTPWPFSPWSVTRLTVLTWLPNIKHIL
jgi:hypothetical protein